MPPPDSHKSLDPVIGHGHPTEDLWMSGIETVDLEELEQNPDYRELLALLAHNGNVLRRHRVTSICRADRSHFNGEGVLHIAPGDFTREGLLTLLGVTETGSPDNCDGPDVATPRRPATAPTVARQTQQFYRSGLLGVLRSVLPPHMANNFATGVSETAARQIEQETQAAKSQRDAIATWFVQKRLGVGATVQPTDKLHTRFNFFHPDGTYSGYSLRISSLPPFLMTYIKATQVGGRWETKVVFEDQPYEKIRASLGV